MGICLDQEPVELVITGIHHEKDKIKSYLAMTLQLLKKLGHQHGVLPAGDADRDPVTFLDQVIFTDRFGKPVEKTLLEHLPIAQGSLDLQRAVFI